MGLELTPGNPRPKEGVLYCLDKDLSVSKKVFPVDISNGLSWSSDNTIMYYCDTFRVSQDFEIYNNFIGTQCSFKNRRKTPWLVKKD